jgi:hypothetical protein
MARKGSTMAMLVKMVDHPRWREALHCVRYAIRLQTSMQRAFNQTIDNSFGLCAVQKMLSYHDQAASTIIPVGHDSGETDDRCWVVLPRPFQAREECRNAFSGTTLLDPRGCGQGHSRRESDIHWGPMLHRRVRVCPIDSFLGE